MDRGNGGWKRRVVTGGGVCNCGDLCCVSGEEKGYPSHFIFCLVGCAIVAGWVRVRVTRPG